VEPETSRVSRSVFLAACLVWLLGASIETVVGVLGDWPAQFGGGGDAAKIDTQWITKGTALSPPLFLLLAMLAALAAVRFARRALVRWLGLGVAVAVGVIGVVGSLGEMLAAATPDVPLGVQRAGIIGVLVSVAVLAAAVPYARDGRRRRD
jgi:hypothetical protein